MAAVIFTAMTMTYLGCGTEDNSTSTAQANGQESIATEGNDVNPEATDPREVITARPNEVDQKMVQKHEENKREITATEENITSPYRYLITTEDFSHFGDLLKESSISKHIHSAGVTVLAPRNSAMEAHDSAWKLLLKNGDTEAIDAFIAQYVVDERVPYKDIKERNYVTNHAGEPLKIITEGGITIAGASISTEEIETRNGIVLVMNELYALPE